MFFKILYAFRRRPFRFHTQRLLHTIEERVGKSSHGGNNHHRSQCLAVKNNTRGILEGGSAFNGSAAKFHDDWLHTRLKDRPQPRIRQDATEQKDLVPITSLSSIVCKKR